MDKGDPAQVLDVLRDVLIEHTNNDGGLPDYQIQSAVFIGHSGRLIHGDHILGCLDTPAGLRLTMRSGHEYDLILSFAAQEEEEADDPEEEGED